MKAPQDFPQAFFDEIPNESKKLVEYTWPRLDNDIKQAVLILLEETKTDPDRMIHFMLAMMEACAVMKERCDPKKLN